MIFSVGTSWSEPLPPKSPLDRPSSAGEDSECVLSILILYKYSKVLNKWAAWLLRRRAKGRQTRRLGQRMGQSIKQEGRGTRTSIVRVRHSMGSHSSWTRWAMCRRRRIDISTFCLFLISVSMLKIGRSSALLISGNNSIYLVWITLYELCILKISSTL